jgi:hypothetical protein
MAHVSLSPARPNAKPKKFGGMRDRVFVAVIGVLHLGGDLALAWLPRRH